MTDWLEGTDTDRSFARTQLLRYLRDVEPADETIVAQLAERARVSLSDLRDIRQDASEARIRRAEQHRFDVTRHLGTWFDKSEEEQRRSHGGIRKRMG